jgi:hypothetical protein
MHRIILAAAVLLAVPATALAVTTAPPQPPTISESSNGAPRCTHLPYTLTSSRHKVILRITHFKLASAKAVKHTRVRNVRAGNHSFGWCGRDDVAHLVKPGTYYWRIGAVQKAGSPVRWSRFRHVTVTA